jgi:hypothetical protein
MATEQVSTNTAEGKGKKAWVEHRRMVTVQGRLAFLKEVFEELSTTNASQYEFSPHALAGLSLIMDALKNDVATAQDFLENVALGVSHE